MAKTFKFNDCSKEVKARDQVFIVPSLGTSGPKRLVNITKIGNKYLTIDGDISFRLTDGKYNMRYPGWYDLYSSEQAYEDYHNRELILDRIKDKLYSNKHSKDISLDQIMQITDILEERPKASLARCDHCGKMAKSATPCLIHKVNPKDFGVEYKSICNNKIYCTNCLDYLGFCPDCNDGILKENRQAMFDSVDQHSLIYYKTKGTT
jgi:hypothetical protein